MRSGLVLNDTIFTRTWKAPSRTPVPRSDRPSPTLFSWKGAVAMGEMMRSGKYPSKGNW